MSKEGVKKRRLTKSERSARKDKIISTLFLINIRNTKLFCCSFDF